MQRRTFLKALGAGLALGDPTNRLYAGETMAGVPDLVAVKNGDPEVLFDRGIAALGGMGRFVKKGQTVVVKPNIGWNVSPKDGLPIRIRAWCAVLLSIVYRLEPDRFMYLIIPAMLGATATARVASSKQ